jgi:hypothetical protein
MNLIKLAADDYIANINVSYSHFARYPKLATGKSFGRFLVTSSSARPGAYFPVMGGGRFKVLPP